MSEPGPAHQHHPPSLSTAPRSVELFHRALRAALQAQMELDLGPASASASLQHLPAQPTEQPRSSFKMPSGRLILDKLEALQSLAQPSSPDQADWPTDPNVVLTQAFGEHAADLPQKYVNGFTVYWLTGRTDLVLDALSVDLRAERELSRVARPSLAYLAVLVVTGILGSGVLAVMLLAVDDLREDLLRVPHSLAVSSAVAPWLPESLLRILPGIALLIFVLIGISLLPWVTAAIVKCFGGFGYLTSQRRVVAAQVEQELLLAGIDGAEAERTAHLLAGAPLQQKHTPQLGPPSELTSGDVPLCKLEAQYYQAQSNSRLRQLRFSLPLLLVILLGSVGVLLYSLTLFVPLTDLLHDLSAPLADPVIGGAKR